MSRRAKFCLYLAVRAAPGRPCPVHGTRDCLVDGWLEYVDRRTVLERVRSWFGR